RRVVLLDLFCDDRHARVAHDHRSRNHDGDFDHGVARPFQSRISRAGGNHRTLLALCRHYLDLSVSAALFAGQTFGRTHRLAQGVTMAARALQAVLTTTVFMSEHIVQPRVYVTIFLALMLGTGLTV